MPFGSMNAAQTFQRLMDTFCHDLEFAFVYINGILVASQDSDTHKQHLCQLFERLKQYSLVIHITKCRFGPCMLCFLGHRITRYGTVPLPDKVEAISQMYCPKTLEDFRSLLE